MKTYKITYPDSNVTQYKVLIKHLWWTYSKVLPEKKAKKAIKCISKDNEWFTEKSPIYDAITTGKLLIYDGTYRRCIVEEVNTSITV